MGKLRKTEIEPTLREMRGNVSAAALQLGVTREYLVQVIARSPALQEVVVAARQTLVDNAESALAKAVLAGEAWAVCFTLKTQGRERGYVERHELTGKDGAPMQVDVTRVAALQEELLDVRRQRLELEAAATVAAGA